MAIIKSVICFADFLPASFNFALIEFISRRSSYLGGVGKGSDSNCLTIMMNESGERLENRNNITQTLK